MKPLRIVIVMVLVVGVVAGGIYGVRELLAAANTAQADLYPSQIARVHLERGDSGDVLYAVTYMDGRADRITPQQYASMIMDEHESRGLGERLLLKISNVTSLRNVGWVALGLIAQIIFAGRMFVQWIASEKAKQSVVPVAFWWLALTGATLLMVYFIWRKDVVGILGQSTGWLIYLRNLYFIYFKPTTALTDPVADATDGPAGAPEA